MNNNNNNVFCQIAMKSIKKLYAYIYENEKICFSKTNLELTPKYEI